MGCDLLLSLSHLATPQLIRDRCRLNHLTSSVGGNRTVSRRASRDSAISSSTLGRRDLFLSENWASGKDIRAQDMARAEGPVSFCLCRPVLPSLSNWEGRFFSCSVIQVARPNAPETCLTATVKLQMLRATGFRRDRLEMHWGASKTLSHARPHSSVVYHAAQDVPSNKTNLEVSPCRKTQVFAKSRSLQT